MDRYRRSGPLMQRGVLFRVLAKGFQRHPQAGTVLALGGENHWDRDAVARRIE